MIKFVKTYVHKENYEYNTYSVMIMSDTVTVYRHSCKLQCRYDPMSLIFSAVSVMNSAKRCRSRIYDDF